MTEAAQRARWWRREKDKIVCELCPRQCNIAAGGSGFCRVRRNESNTLVADSYGFPLGLAVDPIEKKPLFHFLPGSGVLSFGTPGCTLACRFCQNWSLSQKTTPQRSLSASPPERLVALAMAKQVPTIAFTYNEPTVFGEYLVDISKLAREAGIRNIMVSNGYVSPQPRNEMYEFIDGVNIDLKGFSETFYREQTGGELAPVLDTLRFAAAKPDLWLEITTLLIPGLNDDPDELAAECKWIAETLGRDVPLHLTAFHPDYQMNDRRRTSASDLAAARNIAQSAGLRYVYTGNVNDCDGQSTRCTNCGETVIARDWHRCDVSGLKGDCCAACGEPVIGIFK